MPVVSVYVRAVVCVGACTFMCVWRKSCQLDVGVQTDGRQASGQLALTAFQKPFTATTSSPYPHSVILAFALLLFLPFLFLSTALRLTGISKIIRAIIK